MTMAAESAIPRRVGRKLLWPERLGVKLPAGTLARIAAVLEKGEVRIELLRNAVLKEIERREAARAKERDDLNVSMRRAGFRPRKGK
jgi:hypothetical protein